MLRARLLDTFARYRDRPALWVGGRFYTYRQLLDATVGVQAALERAPDATVVGILAERSLAAYAGVLGAVLAGRTYLPLNASYPQSRLLKILACARPGAVIVDRPRLSIARQLFEHVAGPLVLILPDAGNAGETRYSSVSPRCSRSTPGDCAAAGAATAHGQDSTPALYLMFTSGTTGEPKGISIGRSNVVAYLDAIEQLFDFGPSDRFSQFFSLSFDLSVHDMFVAWTCGACVYVPSGVELIDPVRFGQRHELSVWFSVPSMASLAMRARKLRPGALPALRHVLFCGEILSRSVAEGFARAAPDAELTNLYGPTEATIAITSYRIARASLADGRAQGVAIGHPFPGQEFLVLNGQGLPVPRGEVGELWLAGSQIASGYLNDADQTAAKFRCFSHPQRNGKVWYKTGDLVEEQSGVGLIYRGRKDEQIKLRGHRIEITKVEEALRQAAATALSIVVPWSSDPADGPERLIAIVCPPHRSETEILQHMRQRLPPFMVPSRIVSVPALEFNDNHKLDRKRIAERVLQPIAS